MRELLAISLILAVGIVATSPVAPAKEIEHPIPMLHDPAPRVPAVGGVLGVSQIATDTFYFGGSVWDASDGQWEAAEPTSPGWANRKMWTWSMGGFGGTPHSGRNMDAWVGVDATTDLDDFFNVEDGTTIGACATSRVLFCGLTAYECEQECYLDISGTGYGNEWKQMVVTPSAFHYSGDVLTLQYDWYSESEGVPYDYTEVVLQTYDTVSGAWMDLQVLFAYGGTAAGGTEGPIDLASYLSDGEEWRVLFRFQSDVGYSDEDAVAPTACGAFWVDNIVVAGTTTNWSENFEAEALNTLPSGWSKYVAGCGDYFRAMHVADLTTPLSLDPCVVAVPGWCEIADSVLVAFDPGDPAYPHPLCQDNYVASPIVDLSSHTGKPGKLLIYERFADLPLDDHVFLYWRLRYKPGCASGGWSPWASDNLIHYTPDGVSCARRVEDVSAYVPPSATQMQVALGLVNMCDEDPWGFGCSHTCNETPYFDNVSVGVFGTDAVPVISMREFDYWQDQFAEDGTLDPSSTADTRIANSLGGLVPPIFGDTLVCRTGDQPDTEVWLAFRMANVGPAQTLTHDFFTTWFPGVTAGGWHEARMDTAEITDIYGTGTVAVPETWMAAFHELDPTAAAEGTEILPNNLFVPGTRIEYFLKTCYTGSPDTSYLPAEGASNPEEFEVLPMMRDDGAGGYEWPCLIVVDHFGQRGNWSECNSDRIARHMATLGYEHDTFSKLGPSSNLTNGIARWAANPGQVGGPGTPKYNWGPGATIEQFVGYRHCILNTGSIHGCAIYEQDVSMLTSWLVYLSDLEHQRSLWLSGDEVCSELAGNSPWGPQFLNTVLCVNHLADSYADTYTDYTYCLPMNGIAGNISCTSKNFYIRQNGCPGKYSEIGISASGGCSAVPEVEYDSQAPSALAGISNSVSVLDGASYRTYTEGYDFCKVRDDASLWPGSRNCGPDNFIGTWMACVEDWLNDPGAILCNMEEEIVFWEFGWWNITGKIAQDLYIELNQALNLNQLQVLEPAGWEPHAVGGTNHIHFFSDGGEAVELGHGEQFLARIPIQGTPPRVTKKVWTNDRTKPYNEARIKPVACGIEIKNKPGNWTGGVRVTVKENGDKHTYVTVNGQMTDREKAEAIVQEINEQYPDEQWRARLVNSNIVVIEWKPPGEGGPEDPDRMPKVDFGLERDAKETDKKIVDGFGPVPLKLEGVPTGSGIEGGSGMLVVQTGRGADTVWTYAGQPLSSIISDLTSGLTAVGENIVEQGDDYFVLLANEGTLFLSVFKDESGLDLFIEPQTLVDVDSERVTPTAYTLLDHAFPNPMNPIATIRFSIGAPGKVMLRVFDVSGRVVRTLVNDVRDTGEYSVVWDGKNDGGKSVGSGVFFYQLEAPNFKSGKKIVILR